MTAACLHQSIVMLNEDYLTQNSEKSSRVLLLSRLDIKIGISITKYFSDCWMQICEMCVSSIMSWKSLCSFLFSVLFSPKLDPCNSSIRWNKPKNESEEIFSEDIPNSCQIWMHSYSSLLCTIKCIWPNSEVVLTPLRNYFCIIFPQDVDDLQFSTNKQELFLWPLIAFFYGKKHLEVEMFETQTSGNRNHAPFTK